MADEGEARLDEGDPLAAARSFLDLLRRRPADGRALSGLGRAALALGNRKLAGSLLESHLARQPDDAEAWWVLAEVANTPADRHRALAALEHVVEADPGRAEAFLRMARLWWALGNGDAARRRVRDCLQLAPRNAEAHLLLGMVLEKWGRLGDALAEYRLARELESDSDDLPGRIAALSESVGQDRRMLAKIRSEVAGPTAEARKLYDLAKYHVRVGEPAAGLEVCDRLLAAHPQSAEFLELKARILVEDDRPEEGLLVAEEAAEAAGDRSMLHLYRRRVESRFGAPAERLRFYGQVLRRHLGRPGAPADFHPSPTGDGTGRGPSTGGSSPTSEAGATGERGAGTPARTGSGKSDHKPDHKSDKHDKSDPSDGTAPSGAGDAGLGAVRVADHPADRPTTFLNLGLLQAAWRGPAPSGVEADPGAGTGPAAALRTFAEGLRLDPDHAGLHTARGDVLAAEGRLVEALASYRKAVDEDAGNARLHDRIGVVHLRRGDPDAARASLRRALDLQAGCDRAHFHLGIVSLATGDPDAAAASFRQALRHNRRHLSARLSLAEVLRRQRRNEEAEEYCRQVVAESPDSPAAVGMLADLLARRGETAAAERLFLAALGGSDTATVPGSPSGSPAPAAGADLRMLVTGEPLVPPAGASPFPGPPDLRPQHPGWSTARVRQDYAAMLQRTGRAREARAQLVAAAEAELAHRFGPRPTAPVAGIASAPTTREPHDRRRPGHRTADTIAALLPPGMSFLPAPEWELPPGPTDAPSTDSRVPSAPAVVPQGRATDTDPVAGKSADGAADPLSRGQAGAAPRDAARTGVHETGTPAPEPVRAGAESDGALPGAAAAPALSVGSSPQPAAGEGRDSGPAVARPRAASGSVMGSLAPASDELAEPAPLAEPDREPERDPAASDPDLIRTAVSEGEPGSGLRTAVSPDPVSADPERTAPAGDAGRAEGDGTVATPGLDPGPGVAAGSPTVGLSETGTAGDSSDEQEVLPGARPAARAPSGGSITPSDADTLEQLAAALLEAGGHAHAAALMGVVLSEETDRATAWALAARAAADTGRWDDAARAARTVLRLAPETGHVAIVGWVTAARVAEVGGRVGEAVRCWRAALDIEPRRPEAVEGLLRMSALPEAGISREERRRWLLRSLAFAPDTAVMSARVAELSSRRG